MILEMNVNMKMIELLTLSLFIYDTISVIYTYPLTLLVSIQFYLKVQFWNSHWKEFVKFEEAMYSLSSNLQRHTQFAEFAQSHWTLAFTSRLVVYWWMLVQIGFFSLSCCSCSSFSLQYLNIVLLGSSFLLCLT